MDSLQQRLSKISTMWTVLHQAQPGTPGATAAQQLLMERYGGAITTYLRGTLRDADAADELTQEFALCLVRGEFRNANRERGRSEEHTSELQSHSFISYAVF